MEVNTTKAYAWGKVYAILNHVQELTPTQYEKAAYAPGLHFAACLKARQMQNYPDLDAMICGMSSGLSPEDIKETYNDASQSDFALGYYHQKHALSGSSNA